jgi:uncharacterized GH25 family protein
MSVTRILFPLIASVFSTAAAAHEFWIDAEPYSLSAGQTIEARLRNGENFEGIALPYAPHQFERFDLIFDADIAPIEGRLGDNPAVNTQPLGNGLHVVVLQTVNSIITYTDFTKFQAFVDHKDLGDARALHAARGLSFEKFSELYGRFPKALIAVGDGAGTDREVGLETEIVALANPYTDDLGAGLPVRLLYQGAPRTDEQIEVFAKAPSGEVSTSLVRTDDTGRAMVPVLAGHQYMLDAVVLRAPAPEVVKDRDAVWETLWATLTFAVPE